RRTVEPPGRTVGAVHGHGRGTVEGADAEGGPGLHPARSRRSPGLEWLAALRGRLTVRAISGRRLSQSSDARPRGAGGVLRLDGLGGRPSRRRAAAPARPGAFGPRAHGLSPTVGDTRSLGALDEASTEAALRDG